MQMAELAASVAAGERRALSRAITLVESARADHRAEAAALLQALPKDRQALRIGLSGTPGVGKSTFIESFGMMLVEAGLRVAVLAVDPSSSRSGGSILGDKTRMDRLARAPEAFIRPSPSQTHLGGVARRSREAVRLCEAAGFDVVLIETVGVGQSETVVAEMSDVFLLLLAPAGDLKQAAVRTQADYAGALRLLRKRPQDPEGFPKACLVSAMQEIGLADVWADIEGLVAWRRENGFWDATRASQARYWFGQEVRTALLSQLETPWAREQLAHFGAQVADGELVPSVAAENFMELLRAHET